MGSGEDAVGENGVTFVEVVFIGVFFVGVAGNGLMVILAVTEARLSLACRFALVAGGLVLLALLFSVLARAINHRRLKQEAVLKTQAPEAGKEPERWEGYKLEFAGGHVRYFLLVPFAVSGMYNFPIAAFSTGKPGPDLLFILYSAVGFVLFLCMIFLFAIVGPP